MYITTEFKLPRTDPYLKYRLDTINISYEFLTLFNRDHVHKHCTLFTDEHTCLISTASSNLDTL